MVGFGGASGCTSTAASGRARTAACGGASTAACGGAGIGIPPAADRLRPEDWEWEVLEAAARDEELAQHLMEEEGWVLAEPSAPFIPGVYQ
jgi:hypothetical protein